MQTRVRLIRRYPAEERRKPKGERKRWVWVLRGYESGGSMPSESVGYYAEARDTWKPSKGEQQRLTVKEAARARQSKQADLKHDKAKVRPSPTARMPWAEFCVSYLAETKGTVCDSTLQSYGESLKIFAQAVSPSAPAEVNAATVKRFVKLQRDGGRSDATIKKHLASLRRVWNDPPTELAKTGNPFVTGRKGLRIRLTVREKEWHWYQSDEIQSVLGACTDVWWRSLIFTAYTTALRLGELQNVRWCDFDPQKLELHVRPRSDDDACWGWVPKGKYRRTLPVIGHDAGMLNRLRVSYGDTSPYIFVQPTRYAEVQRQRALGRWHSRREPVNNLLRDYKGVLARAGVEVNAFHSLRKSCITNWLADGVPPHEVQAMAGHADLTTTMRYYSKVSTDAMVRVREASERSVKGVVA